MSAEWITRNVIAPCGELEGLWESVIIDRGRKERLENQVLLSLSVRGRVPFSVSALHALILLHGPPGTGKTTLARGLAQQLSAVTSAKKVRLLEVDPHGLMSAEHGQSQQRVTELLCETIPALCEDGLPAIVLLDEVESMAVARSEASLAANPADVHRATDAVLMALDRNADRFPHIVTVATSNFTAALDEAFRSRADLSLEIPLPDATAAAAILGSALNGFAVAYPALGDLARSPEIRGLGDRLVGLDGRQIRKLVTEAMAMRREVVIEPGALSLDDLHAAIDAVCSAADPREAARAAL
jgi:AAA+ superfamily predicted ATPase